MVSDSELKTLRNKRFPNKYVRKMLLCPTLHNSRILLPQVLVSMLRVPTALRKLTVACCLVHVGQSRPQIVGHPLVGDISPQGYSLHEQMNY